MSDQPFSAGVIMENPAGEILVLQRQNDRHEGGTWGLPGGKVEPHEEPVVAAVRETEEETGIRLSANTLTADGFIPFELDSQPSLFAVFRCQIEDTPAALLRAREHQAYAWKTPKDLVDNYSLMTGLGAYLRDTYHL